MKSLNISPNLFDMVSDAYLSCIRCYHYPWLYHHSKNMFLQILTVNDYFFFTKTVNYDVLCSKGLIEIINITIKLLLIITSKGIFSVTLSLGWSI